ncbi:hypothetical protein GCM10010172_02030 [Paractinoplanes ferrugineus]|uniref:CBM2 domain-containing protein n=1 Tax=Paractinoplanes ferrugineus TaxID=113564 RepID=A0A919J3Y5_9ACTN|nr:cellulose-binding domain-containing protein [Actinoplanes ferrugineus]GIE14050.1 hypothetical protein Afe05nite_58900 [Actinoplanes ferrugineus]
MRRCLVWALACLITAFAVVGALKPAYATAGCRVDYAVPSSWQGGFQGSMTITNLGDPLSSWRLGFTFPNSTQKVVQGWTGTWAQSGRAVTVTNAGYNGAVPTGSSMNVGFTGSWSGSNPAPAGFTVNGVACVGAAPVTTSPTAGDPWNPPSSLVSPLAAVWSHEEATYSDLFGFKNYGWDQLFAAGGQLNYCVRWDSAAHVTAAQRDAIAGALQRQYQKWVDALLDDGAGWNNWPYRQVPVKVVGWAVRDRAQLEWSDPAVDIYVNDISENAPQCGTPCGRFFHQDGDYSGCPGGASHHYDHSLWLTAGFSGGAGGDWGQRIGSEYYLSNLNAENIHILLHEMGHTYGLDDFYDWDPTPGQGFLMKAGSATAITDFDKWMLRDWWRHLKTRYGR